MAELFEIKSFRNQIRVNESGTEAHIRPLLGISMARAATVFVTLMIDGMEMFSDVRYELVQGEQSVFLKEMRVVNPRSEAYEVAVRVSVSMANPDYGTATEMVWLKSL